MNEDDKNRDGAADIIDADLYEDIDDEEMKAILDEERAKRREKREEGEEEKPKRPFPKWAFWLIAAMMTINIVGILPKTFSLPAVDFLVKSAELMTNPDIDRYQESVVVIESGQSKGTGFSISEDGYIITNAHVIDNEMPITVAFEDEGLYGGEVIQTFEDVDLALLKVEPNEGESLPYLPLADETIFEKREHVFFIGNPLRFNGIANEGEVIGYRDLSDWERQVLMLDAPIYHGNSGSPVITEDGYVIAVIFATLKDQSHGKVGLAVPITYFHEKIKNIDEPISLPSSED
ncbi:peptidase S7 [Pontibacillus chungwhensis BH030062]|uniref:Peptidase S7 n=1 Tax=Pontibacillus chungwhensis BH030062 TaxID=1385513 RepID=A0A0A2UUF9_9BACI|nr:serine protease [Pontibacillus chungwhensis]KGP90343.1 peptidase S7 [Pontibacillus chungwhensis BH030062]